MTAQLPSVQVETNWTQASISKVIASGQQPIIFKGLIASWPAVAQSNRSPIEIANYLRHFNLGDAAKMQIGIGSVPAKENGRLFYNSTFTGFNFTREASTFDAFLTALTSTIDAHQGHYMGSTPVDKLLPGFKDQNHLAVMEDKSALASIWISNETRVAVHQDLPNNIACCVTGRRRFTLFPPEQVENLYIGPLDLTPAGQPISLVDLNAPDLVAFPKFSQALQHAQVAELAPGDALFVPSLWWHGVEGLGEFNVLVNYWWQETAHYVGAPMDALLHSLLNIKSLPAQQKQALQHLFQYYVFNESNDTFDHIPEHAKGVLDNTELAARKIRAMLINKLNR